MNFERPRFAASDGLSAIPPDLAHLEPFSLGAAYVVPATRRLDGPNGNSTVLEPLVMQVLVSLARAGGDTLSRDDLVSECWGRKIVGDDAVNRVISRLRRSLAQVTGDQVAVETIAKVGYRLSVRSGSPVLSSVDDQKRGKATRRGRYITGGIVAVTILAAIIGARMLGQYSTGGIAIAIEPIAGVGSDVASSQFAADLTTDVARLTGSMTQMTLVEPGAATRADMKLEVTYRGPASDEDARIRLVDTGKGAVIWSRSFEAYKISPALVRERAAYAIAGVIRCGLDRSAGNLGDPVSKRLYFAACDAVEARDWPRARSFAQQIAHLRPDSAGSWACLAMTTAHVAEDGPARLVAARDAAAYARRALALDPHSGLAHQAFAMALEMQGRPAFDALERGVKLDPEHGGLLARYSFSLFALGYVRASVEPAMRSIALEPNDFGLTRNGVYNLLGAGRIADARELQARAERLWPDHSDSLAGNRAEFLFYSNDAKSALEALDRAKSSVPMPELTRLELTWRAAPTHFDWASFDRVAGQEYAIAPSAAWSIVFSAARMNDIERALAWLVKAPRASLGQPWFSLFRPDAAELRRDPRFFAKMADLGLVKFWHSRDRWPDFCSDPKLHYDCRREAARLLAPKAR